MNKFTSKALITATLLASASLAQAQGLTFERNSIISPVDQTLDNPSSLYATHRTVPLWIDFNNDGNMDVYYAGTSYVHGWQTTACVLQNQGSLNFYNDSERLFEEYTYEETDDKGNVVEKTGVREIGVKSGMPKSAYGMGSVAIDYDQDGLTDFIFLNRGGNDTGTERELVLVHNLGDFKFEKVSDEALYNVGFDHNNNNSFNEDQEIGTISVGDYDKDGYPDVVVEGTGSGGRFVRLLHNKRGTGFELVKPVKPIAFTTEINPIGLYEKSEDVYDADGILIEPGKFIDVPTGDFKPMSHGSVSFGDFDNDGWLDIVATGYYDGNGDYAGGDGIRFYRNLGDGTFQDVTDLVAAACGTDLAGIMERWGTEDSGMSVIDFNQDGKQDIFFTGSMRGRDKKVAIVLQNVTDGGAFAFEETSTGILPTAGVTCRLFTVADFNGDDYADFILRGWTNKDDINDWRYSINLSNNSNTYTYDMFNENEPAVIGGHFCETMSFGDFDGDGQLDAITTDWGANDYTAIHLNKSGMTITAPDAPQNVTAEVSDNRITVKWDAASLPNSGNEPLYNLYVKNNTTGKAFTIVPAILETGKQTSYSSWDRYVLSGGVEPSYTFCNLPDGDYTVGVQTVSYNYAASAFATAEATVTTAIRNVDNASAGETHYFTIDGRRADSSAKGILIVKNANGVKKILK